MQTKVQRIRRPLIKFAVLGWISYVFVAEGFVNGIIATSLVLIIASTMDS